jgi:hypothetical protein
VTRPASGGGGAPVLVSTLAGVAAAAAMRAARAAARSSAIWSFSTCCHASAAHSKASVLPVPVGLSSSACSFRCSARRICVGSLVGAFVRQ